MDWFKPIEILITIIKEHKIGLKPSDEFYGPKMTIRLAIVKIYVFL